MNWLRRLSHDPLSSSSLPSPSHRSPLTVAPVLIGIPGFEILFVQYRTLDRSKTVDVTSHIRQIVDSGAETLHLTTRLGAGGKDPSMTEKKEMVFIYNRHGKGREKVFPEGHQMDFKRDLD